MLGSPVARRWAQSEMNRSLNQFLQDTYYMLGAVIHTENEGFQVRHDPHSSLEGEKKHQQVDK